MARRYGKLPTEILNLTIDEFDLNMSICYLAIKEENKQLENLGTKKVPIQSLGGFDIRKK